MKGRSVIFILIAAAGVLACGSCARQAGATAPGNGKASAATNKYTFEWFTPTPDAVEVAPGLFADVIVGAWDAALPAHEQVAAAKRPGLPFESIGAQTGDRAAFGVTVLFVPAEQFADAEVRYRETLTLPAPAEEWPEPDDELPAPVRQVVRVSADRRSCMIEQTVHMKPGQMIPSYLEGDRIWVLNPFPTHVWGVAPGDPLGRWTIEAYVNDQPVARHQFEVTEGKTVRFRGLSSTAPATRPGAATQPSAGTRVDVATFRKLAIDGGDKVVILDVRTLQEFAEGHLAGAINIDSSSPDFEQKLAALDRDKTYLVYCRTGRRGTQACVALDKLKFPAANLYNLEGGIVAWEKAGENIEK